MFENRNLKLDLFSVGLVAASLLITASLATYDPADPPSSLIDPPRAHVNNGCGRVGAYVAHSLFAGFGYGAYFVAGSIAVVAVMLTVRRDFDQPVLRGVGWTVTLVAVTTLAAMALPYRSPGPEIGAGGYLGAMGWAVLESHFALAGAYILALAVLLAGMLLATDYLVFRVAAGTAVASGVGFRALGSAARMPLVAVTRRRANDVDGELDELLDEEEEEAEYEEEEGEEEYEYEYEDEEEGDEDAEYEEDEEEEAGSAELTVRTPGATPDAEASRVGAGGAPVSAVAEAASGLKEKLAAALRIKNRNGKEDKAAAAAEVAEIIGQLEAADSTPPEDLNYELPPLDLLLPAEEISYEEHEKEVRRKAKILERTCRDFGVNVKVVEIETGPVISMYELELEAGLRLAKITSLEDDLAIALRAPSVRVVAPIPGKNTVGIEVPNERRQLVRIREIVEQSSGAAKRMKIPIFLGKDVSGNPLTVDLAALPHLLIAGRTGTGKSVCLNSIIVSMLMARGPDEVRMLMIDPKMVELSGYKKLPHLMHPVVTDMKKAEAILAWAVDKMEERYALLARAGVRHLTVYNQLSDEELRERIQPASEAEWEFIPRSLPFIVIVADEMADLMMTAGKEVEQHIIRLAQKSRAVGIHLILATQKPTVDVITGLIKSNLPARIAFQVASKTDSRVVLDENGAEKLLGNGDMLFLSPGTSQLLRGQGTYLSDDEITRVTDFVGTDSPQFARELIELKTKEEAEAGTTAGGALKNRDELYEQAVDVVVRERRGSCSLLQRCLGIGYGRASRLIDFMAEDGIVGQYNGSQARDVLISVEEWEAMARGGDAGPPPTTLLEGPPTVATVASGVGGAGMARRPNIIIPGTDDPSDLEPPRPLRSDAGSTSPPAPARRPSYANAALSAVAATSSVALQSAPWEEEGADDAVASAGEATVDEYDSELEERGSAWSADDSELEQVAPLGEGPMTKTQNEDEIAWEADDDDQVDPEWVDESAAAADEDELCSEDDASDEFEEGNEEDEDLASEGEEADDDSDEYEYEYEYEDEEEDEEGDADDSEEEYEEEDELEAAEEEGEGEEAAETDDDEEAEYEYVYEYEDEEEGETA